MVIDTNMYWLPEALFEDQALLERFLSEMPQTYGLYGYEETLQEGLKQIVIEKPKGYQNLNYVQGEYQLDRMLKDMDLAGIDKAVMKIPCCHEWLSLEMCKLFNDGMADYAKRSNGRLIPLAVIPPIGSKSVFDEIDRCMNELHFNGIQLVAHYGNKYLDDELFESFFDYIDHYHATVYIHHTPVPVQYDSLYDYNNLRRSYGRCVDQTTAIGRELFSGFFTKHPHLKFVHSMLGGGYFAIANMMMPHKEKQKEAVERFKTDNEDVAKQLKENIFFEMSHAQPWGKAPLECAVKVLGSDHILFGTSYPVRKVWQSEGAQFVEDLDLSQEDQDNLLYRNAMKLYHIE